MHPICMCKIVKLKKKNTGRPLLDKLFSHWKRIEHYSRIINTYRAVFESKTIRTRLQKCEKNEYPILARSGNYEKSE